MLSRVTRGEFTVAEFDIGALAREVVDGVSRADPARLRRMAHRWRRTGPRHPTLIRIIALDSPDPQRPGNTPRARTGLASNSKRRGSGRAHLSCARQWRGLRHPARRSTVRTSSSACTRLPRISGTGIGLAAMVKRIITAMAAASGPTVRRMRGRRCISCCRRQARRSRCGGGDNRKGEGLGDTQSEQGKQVVATGRVKSGMRLRSARRGSIWRPATAWRTTAGPTSSTPISARVPGEDDHYLLNPFGGCSTRSPRRRWSRSTQGNGRRHRTASTAPAS